MCVNTGPRTTRSSRVDGSRSAWPVMSDGIMSGVNCTRACGNESACDSARTRSVLPSPGTPSMSTCPEATSAVRTCSMTSDCPTTARWMASRKSLSVCAASSTAFLSRGSMSSPCCYQHPACGFEHFDRVAEFVSVTLSRVVNRRVQAIAIEARELGDARCAFSGIQVPITRHTPGRRLFERARTRRMERLASSAPQRETAGAANLLRQRASSVCRSNGQWAKTHAVAPEHKSDEHQCRHYHRLAVQPDQPDERRTIFLRQEVQLITPAQLRRGHEQPPVIGVEQRSVAKWRGVDDGDAALASVDTHRLRALAPAQRPCRSSRGNQCGARIKVANPVQPCIHGRVGHTRAFLPKLIAQVRRLRLRVSMLSLAANDPRPRLELGLSTH